MTPKVPALQIKPDAEESGEIALYIDNIQPNTTLYDLMSHLEVHGSITHCQIFEDKRQEDRRRGKVTFSPPPSPFWKDGQFPIKTEEGITYNVQLRLDMNSGRERMVRSPFRKNVFYPEKTKLRASTQQFGVMIEPNCMMPMQTLRSQNSNDLSLTVNLKRRKLQAHFKVPFIDPRSKGDKDFTCTAAVGDLDRVEKYMFEVSFDQLKSIQRVDPAGRDLTLLMTLDSPPQYFRWRNDDKTSKGALSWVEWDSWFRQTDIEYDPFMGENALVALHKETPVIDIGNSTIDILGFMICTDTSSRSLDYLSLGFQE